MYWPNWGMAFYGFDYCYVRTYGAYISFKSLQQVRCYSSKSVNCFIQITTKEVQNSILIVYFVLSRAEGYGYYVYFNYQSFQMNSFIEVLFACLNPQPSLSSPTKESIHVTGCCISDEVLSSLLSLCTSTKNRFRIESLLCFHEQRVSNSMKTGLINLGSMRTSVLVDGAVSQSWFKWLRT